MVFDSSEFVEGSVNVNHSICVLIFYQVFETLVCVCVRVDVCVFDIICLFVCNFVLLRFDDIGWFDAFLDRLD